jgi:hypothetical protein
MLLAVRFAVYLCVILFSVTSRGNRQSELSICRLSVGNRYLKMSSNVVELK